MAADQNKPERETLSNWLSSLRKFERWHGIARAVIGVAVSLLFIALLARRIDIRAVGASIRQMTPVPIGLALACLAAGYGLRIRRSQFMLKALAIPASYYATARAFMAGSALNNLLPMRTGDVVRAVAFAKDLGASPSIIAGTLVIERLFDMLVLLIIFFAVLWVVPENRLAPAIIEGARVVSIVAIAVAACVLVLPRGLRHLMHRLFGPPGRHAVLGFIDRLLTTIAVLCRPRVLAALLLFSVGGWLLEGAYYAGLASAFRDFSLPLTGAYTCLALGALSTLIPSSPGYLGTFHYFVSQGAIAFGLSADDAAAYAVVTHGIAWFSITCAGLVLLAMRRAPGREQAAVQHDLSHPYMEPVSVFINVFNEAGTIEGEIRAIHQLIVTRLPGSELIVAEDGSRDGTGDIIRRLVAELGIIHSTSTERKGYAKAFRDAVELAKNKWVFFSDTGGKNDFADFWKLYEAREGADLVIGVRAGRRDQRYRQALTWGYNRLLQIYFGLPVTDADSGFRIYRTDILRRVARQSWINKELISSELAIRMHSMGAVIREVPIFYRQRKGVSRGLPPGKIPKVIFRVVTNMPKLKRAAAALRESRG